jgi:hypothetical protein
VPFVLFSGFDPHDDLTKIVAELLDRGEWHALDDGALLLTPSGDPDERRRVQNRTRQARARARKRGDASRSERDARHADALRDDDETDAEFDAFRRGNYPPPSPKGLGGEGNPEKVTPSVTRDASVTRNAESVTRDASRYMLPPLTDEQRETGRERVRELGDALRELRGTNDH